MRIVNPHLLDDKMDEAVTHYINAHQQNEEVHVDPSSLSLNVQNVPSADRVVTVMHPQNYPQQLCRQVGEQVAEPSTWGEEFLEAEGKLAAIVAHLATQQQSHRTTHHIPHQKIPVRSEVDPTVLMDAPLRLFNGQALQSQGQQIAVPRLPPLHDMKRCQDNNWFTDKADLDKNDLKDDGTSVVVTREVELAGTSPAHNKLQSKKSLPHKKRISKKLKRTNGNITPHQDIVVLECPEAAPQEEILPDNFTSHEIPADHHVTHEVRPILLCQLCGDFYGEDQLKFYQHLKSHYEPHSTIIIENPVPDLTMDKMTNTCIVDNVSNLPDSLVELSLENSLPTSSKGLYQPMKEHVLYTSAAEKPVNNKVLFMEKEHVIEGQEKNDEIIYEALDNIEVYICVKCDMSFRKQKQCEAHIKEVHSKVDEINEFSEPEDLMEGINVTVGEEVQGATVGVNVEENDCHYDSLLPHLTVENGHIHQDHVRHWYMRGACDTEGYCPVCPPSQHHDQHHLKEEFQRIFESEVPAPENEPFTETLVQENNNVGPETEESNQEESNRVTENEEENNQVDKKQEKKKFECNDCGRVLNHRNSLSYHLMAHKGDKPYVCLECGKAFYTSNVLKVHQRVHNGDRPYKCEECGRFFRQWGDLKYHNMSLHTKQKSFKCDFCGKEFARKYSLNIHRRIHTGEKNYKCEYCNMSFRASSYRSVHMRTHTGEKPHKCPICSKRFRVGGDLRRHILIHNKSNDKKTKGKADIKAEDKTSMASIDKIKLEPIDKIETTKKKSNSKKQTTSTTKATDKKIDKKSTNKKDLKKVDSKKGYPNVTVNKEFKPSSDEMINEQFSARNYQNQNEYRFKDIYSNSTVTQNEEALETDKNKSYPLQYVKVENDKPPPNRVLTNLRPSIRDSVTGLVNNVTRSNNSVTRLNSVSDLNSITNLNNRVAGLNTAVNNSIHRLNNSDIKVYDGNTDGETITVYTHVSKDIDTQLPVSPQLINDIRSHISENRDIQGESVENGFIERLTALYNIPA